MTEEAAMASNDKVATASFRSYEIMLRILVFLFTFVAAVLVCVDKQTKRIYGVPFTAKWQNLSALVFFLISNNIAWLYAAGSVIYAKAAGSKNSKGKLVVMLLDLMILGLQFSAIGAATAVGVLGQYGNSHTNWHKVCYVFSAFCEQMLAALILSISGTFVLLWLVVIAVFHLYKGSIR
ncbi:CASP-like protein 1E1 [Mercurialis annua]|uniref:CASP-like protein 1E1 n=1 Tax=Mercurialis annua TaxID=3986 RepID=UPI00215F01FB|nr:CASP-like protein 1E1 [Mercurialis annua]